MYTKNCQNCNSPNFKNFSPWVFVTYNCSCRCEYCMIPHMESSSMNMSPDTFRKMLEITLKLIESGEYDTAHFRLSGGEPFMMFNNYKDIVTEYRKLYPKKMYFGILTNFVKFNDEIADWMEMNNIGMQISLDDLENGKPLINGKSSSEKVLNNILKLMSRNIQFSFNTVLDINKTKDLTGLANFVSSFKNVEWGLNASYTEKDKTKTDKVIKVFDDCIFQLVKRGFDIYNNLRFYNSIVGQNSGGCTAGINSVSIGTNLEVWPCQSLCNKEKLGFFDENINKTLKTSPENEYFRNMKLRKECYGCSVFAQCNGGCRATHYNNEINDIVCEIRKNIIGKLVTGYYTKNNCNHHQCMKHSDSLHNKNIDTIISDYISKLPEIKETFLVLTPEINFD